MLRTRPAAAAAAATPPRCRFASSRLAMAAMRRRSCRPRLFSDDASGPAARRSPTKAVGGACDKDSVQHFTLDEYDYPTPDTIHACPPPRRFSEYSSETLGVMAGQGVHGAFKERLLREIMRVDGCPYAESYAVLGEMNRKNEELMWLFQLPYRISIGATALIGLFAVPAVFHRDTALWFCTHFVKNETPPVETLDTMWKVGSWTWEWMEPAIGTASFCLLALQLIRSQMVKIDLKPYYGLVSSWRADRLTNAFPRATPSPEPIPQSACTGWRAHSHLPFRPSPPPPHSSTVGRTEYEREIVRDYAKSDLWARDTNKARKGFPANSVIPSRGLGR